MFSLLGDHADRGRWFQSRGSLVPLRKRESSTLSARLSQREEECFLLSFPLYSSAIFTEVLLIPLPLHPPPPCCSQSGPLTPSSVFFLLFHHLPSSSFPFVTPGHALPPRGSDLRTFRRLFTFFPPLLRRHVLVRGALELQRAPLGERLRGELVSGEARGGRQRRGRRTAPLPDRRLAGPPLLLPHHAGWTGGQLSGHLCHFQTQTDEDGHQLLHR